MIIDQKIPGVLIILAAVLLMVSAQLIFKNRLSFHGEMSLVPSELLSYLMKMILDWKAWLAGCITVASALLWYVAVSRVPLSFAFPIAALSYPLIMIGSAIFFQEGITVAKIVGNTLIISGVLIVGLLHNNA